SDESGSEVHLRVIAAKLYGFLDHRITVKAQRGIRLVLAHPLLKGFREIAQVEGSQRCCRGIGEGARTGHELGEEFLGGGRVLARVEGGAAKGFHVHEDNGIGVEDGDGIGCEIFRIVGFRAGQIPIVADPGKRFGATDIEGMTDERWTSERGAGDKNESEQKSNGEAMYG